MSSYGPGGQGEPSTFDPLDIDLARSAVTAGPVPSDSRTAPGWSTGALPALLLLLSGAAIGPQGLRLVTPRALAFLDPAAPIALAALGVVAGLSVRTGRADRQLVAASAAQALVTAVVVSTVLLVAAPAAMMVGPFPTWIVALVIGVCAATSSALPPDPARAPHDAADRLDLRDYLLPIVGGGVLMALIRNPAPVAALSIALQATAIAVVIAVAGWLLLSQASTPAEQRVCVFASLLLLGGAADYLSMSSLLEGLVAGICWQFAGGAVAEYLRRDVAYVQHSLLVLILLMAGARAEFSAAALTLALGYVIVRSTGKLLGGWLATRWSDAIPRNISVQLIAPGVFGVAFAANVVRAGGPEFTPVLTAVVVGTIASSVVAAFSGAGAANR